MLKTRLVELAGKDAGKLLQLTELSALVADRVARAALVAIDAEPSGGVVALAMQHLAAVRALGERGVALLLPFVVAHTVAADGALSTCNLATAVRDWRNIERLQNAALLLHVDFLIGRTALEIPVKLQAEMILAGATDISVTFCSPQIAAVLNSDKASYRELETVLSTEDVYNLVELLNVAALREYHNQATNR